MNDNYNHSYITSKIIKAYYNVYNKLGFGFLEKVYEKSMLIELQKSGLCCERQYLIIVYYDEDKVGEYFADILVEDSVIIELKVAESLCQEHEVQLINYLKVTEIEVGILWNIGKEPDFKRKVFSKEFKKKISENHK